MRTRGWNATLACLAALASLAPSQWQGPSKPHAQALPVPTVAQDRFLLLNTGGSGGMFGQGDIRYELRDVHFWDEHLGWACGIAGAFMTEDGGLTWRRMKPKPQPGTIYHHVELTGPREVWLLEGKHPGGAGKVWLWHSKDGGATWQEQIAGKLLQYTDLYCRHRQRWVLCLNATHYRSDDGGQTWCPETFGGLLDGAARIAIPADIPTQQGFTIYVFGSHNRQPCLVKSNDGGRTWERLSLPPNLPDMPRWYRCQLFFSTSRIGWIGTLQGIVLSTEDGGMTWQRRDLPISQDVTALWFDQLGRGFAAVENGFVREQGIQRMGVALYETRDGGRRWIPVLSGKKAINAIFGLGSGRVWAVGDVPGFAKNDLVAILKHCNEQHR